MKTLYIILSLLCFSFTVKSQSFPTDPNEAFAFPLGCKATIQLVPIDSVSFQYSVLNFEPFTKIIDMSDKTELFPDSIQENTIDLIFGIGFFGTDKGNEKDYKTLLLIKSAYGHELDYKADMQVYNKTEFEKTSVVNLYPKVLSIEMWPYRINNIALYGFKKEDRNQNKE